MIPVDLALVCRITGGRLVDGAQPDTLVTGPVVIDSRRCGPGSLFVCVPGERTDGHAFAAEAVAAGAVGALASRPVGVPAVLVDDPQAALGRLAAAVLDLVPGCRVVGVTGSSGKTSTKDLLAHVFETAGETVAPEGSFNNELGLPLTVLRVGASTRTLVCEYSARRVGHIRYLCGIARPSIGVVLNVGVAHLGVFGSREAIAEAKGELVEAVRPDGLVVLNADDPLVAAMRDRSTAPVTTFGTVAAADVRVTDLTTDALARPRFTMVTEHGRRALTLRLHGAHQALNAAAVAAAVLGAGLSFDAVTDALQSAVARSARRMQVHERADGLLVVDDSYNANPESTRAALQALVALGRDSGRRTWAVLGEMLELGDDAPALHEQVGADAARLGVDEVVAVGTGATGVASGARGHAAWHGRARAVPDVDAASTLLRAETTARDVVLVKASNGVRLWRVAEVLLAEVPTGATG